MIEEYKKTPIQPSITLLTENLTNVLAQMIQKLTKERVNIQNSIDTNNQHVLKLQRRIFDIEGLLKKGEEATHECYGGSRKNIIKRNKSSKTKRTNRKTKRTNRKTKRTNRKTKRTQKHRRANKRC